MFGSTDITSQEKIVVVSFDIVVLAAVVITTLYLSIQEVLNKIPQRTSFPVLVCQPMETNQNQIPSARSSSFYDTFKTYCQRLPSSFAKDLLLFETFLFQEFQEVSSNVEYMSNFHDFEQISEFLNSLSKELSEQ